MTKTAAVPNRSPASGRDGHRDVSGLAEELERRVQGEVRFDRGSRRLYAFDASVYRQMPIGVVVPRSDADVEATLETLPFSLGRWVTGDEGAIERAATGYQRALVHDRAGRPLILFETEFALRRTRDDADGLELHAVSP